MALRCSEGISPSDLRAVRKLFNDAGLEFRNHAFHYSAQDERWEVYNRGLGNIKVGVCLPSSDWEAV